MCVCVFLVWGGDYLAKVLQVVLAQGRMSVSPFCSHPELDGGPLLLLGRLEQIVS